MPELAAFSDSDSDADEAIERIVGRSFASLRTSSIPPPAAETARTATPPPSSPDGRGGASFRDGVVIFDSGLSNLYSRFRDEDPPVDDAARQRRLRQLEGAVHRKNKLPISPSRGGVLMRSHPLGEGVELAATVSGGGSMGVRESTPEAAESSVGAPLDLCREGGVIAMSFHNPPPPPSLLMAQRRRLSLRCPFTGQRALTTPTCSAAQHAGRGPYVTFDVT
jgi:hypothetical protein